MSYLAACIFSGYTTQADFAKKRYKLEVDSVEENNKGKGEKGKGKGEKDKGENKGKQEKK